MLEKEQDASESKSKINTRLTQKIPNTTQNETNYGTITHTSRSTTKSVCKSYIILLYSKKSLDTSITTLLYLSPATNTS